MSRPVFHDLTNEVVLSMNLDSFSDRDRITMLRRLLEKFQPALKEEKREKYLDACEVIVNQANQWWR